MPITAQSFADTQKSKHINVAFKTALSEFAVALRIKDKNDKTFKVRDYLDNHVKKKYSDNQFYENIDIFHKHYQKKFIKTQNSEYDIGVLHLDFGYKENECNKIFSPNAIQELKNLFEPSIPQNNETIKKIVMFDENHATPLFIKNNNTLIIFYTSEYDYSNQLLLEELLKKSNLKKEIHICENHDIGNDNESPQQSKDGCILFAFKYIKMLCANDYDLFKQLKILPSEKNIYIIPPDLLKYAQSEKVVTKAMNSYALAFGLPEDKKQAITDSRQNKYGKFHILYHQIKHYTGGDDEKVVMIEKLKELTENLDNQNSKKRSYTTALNPS